MMACVALIMIVFSGCICTAESQDDKRFFFEGVWGAIGDSAKETWDEAGDLASETWNFVAEFADESIENASEFKDAALEITQEYALEVWGKAADAAIKAWVWTEEHIEEYREIIAYWIHTLESDELEILLEAYKITAEHLGIDEITADSVWDCAMQYAQSNDIEETDIAKLTLAAVTRIAVTNRESDDLAADVIDYICQGGITDQMTADAAVGSLKKTLQSSSEDNMHR